VRQFFFFVAFSLRVLKTWQKKINELQREATRGGLKFNSKKTKE
jgi:hypothetical protein